MTILSFECKKCNKYFNFNVGRIKIFPEQKINFQKETKCPFCGESSKEFLEITKENTEALCRIYDEDIKNKAIKSYRPGKLVGYSAIFGRGNKIKISFDSKEYYVLDSYCIISDCDCKEAHLDFYEIIENKHPAEWSFLIAYNYFKDRVSEYEGIDREQSIQIINLLLQENKKLFEQRHNELKNFLKDKITNKIKRQILKRDIKNIPYVKIGRNEPCPCGSGKKYKKCCLDKEVK